MTTVKCRGCGEQRDASCGTADCPVLLQLAGDLDTPGESREFTEEPVPPCRPDCERCAKALRVLGPVGYNNWRSWEMYADPPEVHSAPVVENSTPPIDAVMMLGDVKLHVDPTMPRGTMEIRSGFTVGVLDIAWRQPAEPSAITGRAGRVFVAEIVVCRTSSGRVSTDLGRAALQGALVRAPDGVLSKIVGVETFIMPEMGVGGRMADLGLLLVPVADNGNDLDGLGLPTRWRAAKPGGPPSNVENDVAFERQVMARPIPATSKADKRIATLERELAKADRRTSEQERIIAAQREKLEAMRAALDEALDGWQAALGIAYHDRMSDAEAARRTRIGELRKVSAP